MIATAVFGVLSAAALLQGAQTPTVEELLAGVPRTYTEARRQCTVKARVSRTGWSAVANMQSGHVVTLSRSGDRTRVEMGPDSASAILISGSETVCKHADRKYAEWRRSDAAAASVVNLTSEWFEKLVGRLAIASRLAPNAEKIRYQDVKVGGVKRRCTVVRITPGGDELWTQDLWVDEEAFLVRKSVVR